MPEKSAVSFSNLSKPILLCKRSELVTFAYDGGKAMLAPEIMRRIAPRGRKFVDVCAGRGNITFRAIHDGLEYQDWLVNDVATGRFFRAIRDRGAEFRATEAASLDFPECERLVLRGDPQALLMEPFACYNGGTFGTNGHRDGTRGGRRTPLSHTKNIRLANRVMLENKIRITDLDWRDCLEAEELTENDFVVFDPPYIGRNVGPYDPESICPAELIEYLQQAPFGWLLCEYHQPIYVEAFGEPVFKKDVRNKGKGEECIWTKAARAVTTVTVPKPLPPGRSETYYSGLTDSALLQEIRDAIGSVDLFRVGMQRELRERMLPALLELKKRTFRKRPNYYESLALIGLNGDRVRQWFYRSHSADEAIGLIEEPDGDPPQLPGRDGKSPSELLLQHCDRMAEAVLKNQIVYAKKLATEFVRVRDERSLDPGRGAGIRIEDIR
ncbi:MAG: hypothetical protein WBQ34_09495 [Candidatus Acidiferrales bacterium]